MKKIFSLVMIFCGIGCCAAAQQHIPARISVVTYRQLGYKEGNYMKDSLGLTTAQTSAADSVMKVYLRSIALLEGQPLSAAQRKQAIQAAGAQRDTDLQAVLTTTLFNAYKSLLQASETRIRARIGTN